MVRQDKIRQYTMGDSEYPEKLRALTKPPTSIYLLGNMPDLKKPVVAIVGARNATPYGRQTAKEFARVFAMNGVQVISGFARGIDRAGHEGALEAGAATYGVLGNGVDICYPRENIDLYERILEQGGFLSEIRPATQPRAAFFPMRNRIISALADKILVVEARSRSGALITADLGLELGKDIYAVPGRLEDACSEGCNRLIAQGACLALSPEDILQDLEIDATYLQRFRKKNKLALAQDEETVYSCIRLQPKHVNELLAETGMPLPELMAVLLRLELKKLIKEITRNQYIRCERTPDFISRE